MPSHDGSEVINESSFVVVLCALAIPPPRDYLLPKGLCDRQNDLLLSLRHILNVERC